MNVTDRISIRRITPQDFSMMGDSWNALLEQSVTNEVFLSWEWMYTWWEIFQNEHKALYILLGNNTAHEIIGIAPFYEERGDARGAGGKRTLRFCSSQETYPDHLDVIVKKGYEAPFTEAVFTFLDNHKDTWEVIKLDGIKEDAVVKKHLSEYIKTQNFIIDSQPESECPYVALNQSYQDYLQTFSAKTRNTLMRKRKKIVEKDQYKFGFLDIEKKDPGSCLRELFSLHAERASRKGIRSSFSGGKIYGFHEKFIARSGNNAKVLIAYLTKESVPAALCYCIKHNNKYYYYQTGLSQEGEQKGAGTVLLSLLIENAFKEHSTEFDFLRGNEDYKYFWANNSRRNYSLSLTKNTFLNRMAYHASCYLFRPGKRIIKGYLTNKRAPRLLRKEL